MKWGFSKYDQYSKEDIEQTSEDETDSESDDDETNLVSQKIKELKLNKDKEQKTKTLKKATSRPKNKTKLIVEKRKIKDTKNSPSKTQLKGNFKARKTTKNRNYFNHMRNVPSREWKPDVVYNHIIPSERSKREDGGPSLPYEYKYDFTYPNKSEKKQIKNIFNSSHDYSNLGPKTINFKRALEGDSSGATKDRRNFKKTSPHLNENSEYKRENSFTEINSSTPYL